MIRRRLAAASFVALSALLLSSVATTTAAVGAAPTTRELPVLAPAQPGTLEACESLIDLDYPSTTITLAESVAAGSLEGVEVGDHCLVRGRMNERVSDVDGKSYAIGFEMRLPVEWSGRYLYQANGGLDGSVVTALGGVGGGESGLQMGFAVISSDAGHNGSQNPTFGIDPQARLDYGYQAVGTLTPMARAVITAGYGRGPDRSYMTGGSNGGRHTMIGAARYSDQYDGFLALAPGFNLPQAAVAQLWGAQQYATVATDLTDLATAFTVPERQAVADAVLARCDGLDGLVDGMVQSIDRCQTVFSVERDVPTCDGERDGTCLSVEQKVVIAGIFAGARTSSGEEIYSSFPVDPGLTQSGWAFWEFFAAVVLDPSAVGYLFTSPPDAPAGNPTDYALSVDIDRVAEAIYRSSGVYTESAMEYMTPPNASQLDAMRARGGKIMVVHGASDGVFSPDDTARWFDELDANYGGEAGEFAAYYEVPGMGHVSGGPATDQYPALAALVEWVEHGQSPGQLVASLDPSNAEVPADWSPTRTRPLCVYPEVAVYVNGDPESAASFRCSTAEAPVVLTGPTISGKPDVGQRLSAEPGEWVGDSIAYSYQWLRDGTPIKGAKKADYRVAHADQGAAVSVRVTAKNRDGKASATSDEVVIRFATAAVVTSSPLIVTSPAKKVTVTVHLLPTRVEATGPVTVSVAGKSFTATAVDGKATVDAGVLPRGVHKIVASYDGSDTASPATGYGLVVVLR